MLTFVFFTDPRGEDAVIKRHLQSILCSLSHKKNTKNIQSAIFKSLNDIDIQSHPTHARYAWVLELTRTTSDLGKIRLIH